MAARKLVSVDVELAEHREALVELSIKGPQKPLLTLCHFTTPGIGTATLICSQGMIVMYNGVMYSAEVFSQAKGKL